MIPYTVSGVGMWLLSRVTRYSHGRAPRTGGRPGHSHTPATGVGGSPQPVTEVWAMTWVRGSAERVWTVPQSRHSSRSCTGGKPVAWVQSGWVQSWGRVSPGVVRMGAVGRV